MDDVCVVTGAGSGIGRAMAAELAGRGMSVVGVGRHAETLAATGQSAGVFEPVVADLATVVGRAAVVEAVGDRAVRILIHNAGRLEPVGPLEGVSEEDWRLSFAINVDAPLFLTRALIPRLSGGRVLHVSSGAAHRPVPGWGTYCATKAALHMVYGVLVQELSGRGIAVGSMRPGVVDTPMQERIRAQNPRDFPGVERFRELKRSGQLESPERVGRFAAALLLDVDADRFSSQEWDIREHGEMLGV